MGSHGLKNQIAIVGMGCTRFGHHRDRGLDDLLVEAAVAAFDSAGVRQDQVDAYWLGTFGSGVAGTTLSRPLKIGYKPVSRNENYCATGSDAFRNACYAVASGAYDVALAIGAEHMSDPGIAGIPFTHPFSDGTRLDISAPGSYSYLFTAYAHKYGVSETDLKDAISHVAWKNHDNGAGNPRAHLRTRVSKEALATAPPLAGNLSLFDCGGLSDGAAAAVVVRAEDAEKYTDRPIYLRGMSFVTGPGTGAMDPGYDFSTFPEVVASRREAFGQAGVGSPDRIGMAEVHDCFTITELILMEDLGFADRGTAWKEILAGTFDRDGALPVNPDGGLKSFGHPLGASGIRMIFECWSQLRGEAADRQLDLTGKYAVTQNLGGYPGECVSFVSVWGAERG
ncbi:acetyl-CoA acetyltransferase [Actinocrispum wychmicini]|uniref:Acetyl-CoA C-acetyltransferase n=1 Tax=Actinocrispum wychmicini TaxID=1213861 RepID=A0A4R2JXM4_9PSEU|nr:acetyl-CoA acetyltransferase [Actinocrispum wychmicini]TCO62106.1 acetyl-CoA C-acetyltransferase [Actinocrispum wychmicini]